MALRGFRNDDERRIPRSYSIERRQSIGKIMSRGGLVRQVLTRAGVSIDTTGWQGLSGSDIADSLTERALSLPDLEEDVIARISRLSMFAGPSNEGES